MAVTFKPGQTLTRGDLDLYLTDTDETATNAAEITYALYYVDMDPTEVEVLIGLAQRVPVNPAVGEYYAALMVPPTAVAGTYRIRWTFKQFVNSTQQQVVQEFDVVVPSDLTMTTYTISQTAMMRSLRMQLRDQNPDKFYHFRPPEHEGRLGKYDRVFGQIWEDAELLEYLERALDWFNMFPPMTPGITSLDLLLQQVPHMRTAVMWQAVVHACFALNANWVADEFDYSIGGVSLSLERSSKYEALKSSADQQFDKAIEAKQRTFKYIRGLQQPRFGIGVRSAFGPAVGRGVLSPRSFM